MADYAPNYTGRVRIVYQVQSKTHRLGFRIARGSTSSDAVAQADLMAAAVAELNADIYTDWTYIGAEYAEEDQPFFIPITSDWSGVVGTLSVASRAESAAAMQVTCPYITSGGHKSFVTLYGTGYIPTNSQPGSDFRILNAERAAVAAFTAALGSLDTVGGDNLNLGFKPYVNIHYNRRWERRVRNG